MKAHNTASAAAEALGMPRLAVAFALPWAAVAWAQMALQPVQPVQPASGIRLQLSEEPRRPAADGIVKREERGPLRGVALRLAVGVGHDDNVFRTANDTRSDFFWSVRPEASVSGLVGKHDWRLGYEGDYAAYFGLDTEDFYDHRLFGDGRLDLTRKVDLELGGQMWWGHDDRGALGARVVGSRSLDRWREHRFKAELVVGRSVTRAQIIPSVELSGIRYLNNDQSARDFDRQDVRLLGRWRFTPRLYAVADAGFASVDHLDPTNDLDRGEYDFLAGVGWAATAKTSGEIKLGILERDFDDPGRGEATDATYEGRLDWDPKPFSRFSFYARRDSLEDASGGLGTILADTVGARWRHAFTERLDLDAGVELTRADYETQREDDLLLFEVGLFYGLRRWLRVGGSYEYRMRDSSVPGFDFDDQRFLLELRASFDGEGGR